MLAIYFLVFIIGDTIVMDKQEEKGKKRRIQNVNSAKKSYETKKKQRQNLQQKNAELEEIQKKLLHSKFRLEAILSLLQHVAETMEHDYSACKSRSEEKTKSQTEASNSVISANPSSSSDVNTCCSLDLFANSQRYIGPTDTLSKHNVKET